MAALDALGTILKISGDPQRISLSVMVEGIPCIYALNFWKRAPYRVWVIWSTNISPVGQCFTTMYTEEMQSFINYYLTLMCLVSLLLGAIPFFPIT